MGVAKACNSHPGKKVDVAVPINILDDASLSMIEDDF